MRPHFASYGLDALSPFRRLPCNKTTTIVRRAGIGRGWEQTRERAPKTENPSRSAPAATSSPAASSATRNKPRAFVWSDEAANDPKREVVICPDLHGSWLWEDGRETSLGVAFPGKKEVQHLARKFDYWLSSSGGALGSEQTPALLLGPLPRRRRGAGPETQALLIEEAVVRYWRPAQDPRGNSEREIRL